MLLREALGLVSASKGKISADRKIALLCSFEPLHLKTFLQAFLAKGSPNNISDVITYGFDQLVYGLEETSTRLKASPVLLCLSWEDIHPALSWRSRGDLKAPAQQELDTAADRLRERLERWQQSRVGAETCIALPPYEWLPLLDPNPAFTVGPTALSAQTWLARIATGLSRCGAKVIQIGPTGINYRDLLQAGCPLSIDQSAFLARRFVEACCYPKDRKKVLVVDLDGTLWHGTIGDDGPLGIEFSAEGRGVTFHVFQKFLRKLKNEGVLLAFCSKNSTKSVITVFDTLGMPLKLSDFATFRCNWEAKSANLSSIAQELNIGEDSLVIIDDNEAELAEIRTNASKVIGYLTPKEGKDWQDLFQALQDLFGTWRVNPEDLLRTESFIQDRARRAVTTTISTSGLTHLRDFGLEFFIAQDSFSDARALELINKTNQFNLTGERISREEWLAWEACPGSFCFSVRLRDRYGDFGVICILVGTISSNEATVRQFVLSCRAFGRGVEVIALTALTQKTGCKWISGPFRDSGKNEPARRFLLDLGITPNGNDAWRVTIDTVERVAARAIEETRAVVHHIPSKSPKPDPI